ncbi:MAG: hypothetical protein IJG18_08770 [Kiritimatiellae bacterium]|nr:hypothetical protein [Kiritimatiellia bacterium]
MREKLSREIESNAASLPIRMAISWESSGYTEVETRSYSGAKSALLP